MGLPAGFLMQNAKLVPALAPQTMAGAADTDWVSLKGYDKCGLMVYITQGNAAQTTITIDSATSVAGAGLVAGVTFRHWYITDTAIGTDAGTNSDAWVDGGDVATLTSSNTGTGASLHYLEVDSDVMVSGTSAFAAAVDCIQANIGASNAANIIAAWYVMYPARYAQAVSPTPSAIID